jgi:hypothetical protein
MGSVLKTVIKLSGTAKYSEILYPRRDQRHQKKGPPKWESVFEDISNILASDCGLEERGTGIRFQVRARDFFFTYDIHMGYGLHRAFD